MRTHSMHVPRCIDTTRNLIVSSHACLVELLDWTDEEGDTVQVPTEGETLEEMASVLSSANQMLISDPVHRNQRDTYLRTLHDHLQNALDRVTSFT